MLEDYSIHAWLNKNQVKNEKGDLIDFRNHLFLFDIYRDRSQNLVVMKAAQVGMSTCEVLKNLYDAKQNKMDIIYTLPTDADVNVFVGGKVNRIIAQNPILLDWTKDKDSIEQKQIGESMIYFRGTWTAKAAIMVTADRLCHDEKDSSKQDVVNEYQARLQHSKFKQKHVFSHPSAPGTGVDVEWQLSDQKHWFVKCSHCQKKQYLSWNTEDPSQMSIDLEREIFICKHCGGEIYDEDRRTGEWVAKYKNREYSGYWVPLLICPWVSAKEIIKKYNDKETTEEFFYNKVLGLPYVGGGNKLTKDQLMANLGEKIITPDTDQRVVGGLDTGLKLDYVLGSKAGLFFHGEAKGYDELDNLMKRWPKLIFVVDAGGDLIGSRQFAERWKGRVFLCYFREDRKTQQLITWGKDKERFVVTADRNRLISLVVSEFGDKKIPLQGTEDDWYDYWLDWNNLTRIKVLNPATGQFQGYKWVRSGRDHLALATIYWRIGIDKFGAEKAFIQGGLAEIPIGPTVTAGSVPQPKTYQIPEELDDWRSV